jgi:hypothetical protein
VPALGPTAVAAIIVYFAALTFWGARLVRRLDLAGLTAVTLLPLGLIVGLAAQLCIANALSYLVPPPRSFPLALAQGRSL